ncbi:hypothetical protein HHI36_014444 [Cryptolaemus montrouzieri]|uniref:Uncharacterized protein n=1 Tax=Cryptolaemus montrouzieri TaxID=559131 RepID=A0ABD2N361_9CUCU
MKAGLDEMNQLNINPVHIHVAGDFNVDLIKSCTRTDDILELFEEFGQCPKFMEPSRITDTSQTLIDNVFSNQENTATKTYEAHLSDHKGQVNQCNFHMDTASKNEEKI